MSVSEQVTQPRRSVLLRLLLIMWALYWPAMVLLCAMTSWSVRVQVVWGAAFLVTVLSALLRLQDPRFVVSQMLGDSALSDLENAGERYTPLNSLIEQVLGPRDPWLERFHYGSVHMAGVLIVAAMFLVSLPFAQLGWPGAACLLACGFVGAVGYGVWRVRIDPKLAKGLMVTGLGSAAGIWLVGWLLYIIRLAQGSTPQF